MGGKKRRRKGGIKWRLKSSDPHGAFITVWLLSHTHSIYTYYVHYLTYLDSVTSVEDSKVSMATGSGHLCYKLVRTLSCPAVAGRGRRMPMREDRA